MRQITTCFLLKLVKVFSQVAKFVGPSLEICENRCEILGLGMAKLANGLGKGRIGNDKMANDSVMAGDETSLPEQDSDQRTSTVAPTLANG